jgi:excisionase family DNA binding protein
MKQRIVARNKLTKTTYLNPGPIEPGEWISQAEAARLRSVSRQAIAKLVGNGRLRTLEVGGRSLVSRAEVLAFEPNPPGRPKAAKT